MDMSMCDVIILLLGPLSHGISFLVATIKLNRLACFKRSLNSIDMSSFLCQVILINLG